MNAAHYVLLAAILLPFQAPTAEQQTNQRQYTYAWQFTEGSDMEPRGGNTSGPEITLADGESAAWRTLVTSEATAKEKDRLAILAMAGAYRASFDFIEVMGFAADYSPTRPYQSWGTEYIYVVADDPDFISLQHILVMTVIRDDGTESDPVVVKHWRQDWRYEDRDLHVYAGHQTWSRQKPTRQAARGAWSQAVFQVDDSPRYEALGRWEHHATHSVWQSELTWRPLPRREFSVRDDYHVLEGTNRVTITARGWIHEEDNLKLVLGEDRTPADIPYLTREAGLNRYELIEGYDFSAGDRYWEETSAFWGLVRDAWRRVYEERSDFGVRKAVQGKPLFMAMFGLADAYRGDLTDRVDAARASIDEVLGTYVH